MHPMRILLVCGKLTGNGGWYTYARSLKSGLQATGHEVVTCTADESGDWSVLHPPLELLSRPWVAWLDAWRLRGVVKKVQPDIIHIAVEPYAFAGRHLGTQWAKKTVVTLHGTFAVTLLHSSAIVRWIENGVRCIAVSEYTKKRCIEEAPIGKHISVVYTGIDRPSFQAKKQQEGAVPHVLLVGGVKPRKGVLQAIRAVAAYKKKYGDIHFSAVGTCDEGAIYPQEVRHTVRDLGVEDNVTLTGPIDDHALGHLYRESDLYLMPSETTPNRFEGFGLVFLEAAARGIPCIGPNASGAVEAIEEGVTGFRVDPEDTTAMVERMHDVLEGRKIDSQACRRFAERFTIERMAKETIAVYG
jgi:glycosyltransferase involved in cell wall biosynthesis